jgi:hypothetical protein
VSSLPRTIVFRALLIALAAGCGPDLPRVYPVKGTVVGRGGLAAGDLAGYGVQFQSVSVPAERPGGTIEEDGTFTLYTRVGGRVIPGGKEGSYKVWFLPPFVEGGKPPPLVIPKKYMSPETSPLVCSVAAGQTAVTLEVERDGR